MTPRAILNPALRTAPLLPKKDSQNGLKKSTGWMSRLRGTATLTLLVFIKVVTFCPPSNQQVAPYRDATSCSAPALGEALNG
jgi:hypothetical protein